MTDRICLFGDGGHASVLKDIAKLNNISIEAIFDDRYEIAVEKESVLYGSIKYGIEYMKSDHKNVIISIGSINIRKLLVEKLQSAEVNFINLVHPNAIISDTVTMGVGNVFMAGTIVNANSIIGNHCIVNTAATIDHDCQLEDFSQLSPGVHLCGGVSIGEAVNIGAGAVIIPQIKVAHNVVIGAGAVVIKDIDGGTTFVGVPAVQIK